MIALGVIEAWRIDGVSCEETPHGWSAFHGWVASNIYLIRKRHR
jgi:hypothetical protein